MALRFKAYRDRLGLDQKAVADGTGLTTATVSRIERGDIDYSGKTLRKFADFFGCDPGDLISDRSPSADVDVVDSDLIAAIFSAVETHAAACDPPLDSTSRGRLAALIYEAERGNRPEEFDFGAYAGLINIVRRHRLTGFDRLRRTLSPHGLRFADDSLESNGNGDGDATDRGDTHPDRQT